MEITETGINGLLILTPRVFKDERGEFHECYRKAIDKTLAVPNGFVQENVSVSIKGVLRGLHYQVNTPQGKLVACLKGRIFDVAVDLRPKSITFGQHFSTELNDQNRSQLYVPKGFAHGFFTVSNEATIQYKCTDYYNPSDESGIRWDDPDLNIQWPIGKKILSPKDEVLNSFETESPLLQKRWSHL